LSPRAGHVPAPVRQGPALASHRSVKAEGIERGFERRRVPSTGCQQPGDNPAHGHVGSSWTEGTSGAADLAPLRGGTGEAALGRFGESWACGVGSTMAPGSPAGAAPTPRQEVPEWIGLGRSSRCAHPSGCPAREASSAKRGRPLTRESSVGIARKPGRARRPACRSRGSRGVCSLTRARGVRKGPAPKVAPRAGPRGSRLEEPPRRRHLEGAEEGNLRRTGRGSGDQRLCSRAVLVAEIDERRRVHAFGHGSSPHAPRTGGQPSGAALPRAEGLLLRAKG